MKPRCLPSTPLRNDILHPHAPPICFLRGGFFSSCESAKLCPVTLLPNALTDKRDVPRAFNAIARSYDVSTALNPGYNRHLRMSADRLRLPPRARVLDLCCGTGCSTQALADAYPDAEIIGLDGSEEMLARARRKPLSKRVDFVLGDAMDPTQSAGIEGPFDGILMAYGIRNMSAPDQCLQRIYRLLAPGGVICFHEYSVADSSRSRMLWNAVCFGIIIPMGVVTATRSPIYRYLRKSVINFDGVQQFEKRLIDHGFVDVHTEPMDGWQKGIVHSFLARKPA